MYTMLRKLGDQRRTWVTWLQVLVQREQDSIFSPSFCYQKSGTERVTHEQSFWYETLVSVSGAKNW